MKWAANQLIDRIADNFPVIFRASLYFFAALLMSLADKLGPIFFQNVWPSAPYTVGAIIFATGSALIALRAYYDGSSQRHADFKSGRPGGSGTEFWSKKDVAPPGPQG